MFNHYQNNSSIKQLKKIYEIEVEGENDFKLIKQDVKDLIEGKKGASFSPNYPL
jgi:tRNA(Ser,Leu) C12 N-acetylase TAN1